MHTTYTHMRAHIHMWCTSHTHALPHMPNAHTDIHTFICLGAHDTHRRAASTRPMWTTCGQRKERRPAAWRPATRRRHRESWSSAASAPAAPACHMPCRVNATAILSAFAKRAREKHRRQTEMPQRQAGQTRFAVKRVLLPPHALEIAGSALGLRAARVRQTPFRAVLNRNRGRARRQVAQKCQNTTNNPCSQFGPTRQAGGGEDDTLVSRDTFASRASDGDRETGGGREAGGGRETGGGREAGADRACRRRALSASLAWLQSNE